MAVGRRSKKKKRKTVSRAGARRTSGSAARARRAKDRARILHEINLASVATMNLGTVMDLLLEKIDSFLSVPSLSTIRILNEENGTMEAAAYRNVSEKEWREAVPAGGKGLSSLVAETRAPVTILDAAADRRTRYPEFFRRFGLVSYLGVPLIVQGRVLGDISLFTKKRRRFSGDEIEFLSAAANQAAVAIHNSQLYEQLRKNQLEAQEIHARLSALYAVTATASQSLDPEKVLQEVVREIREIFGFDAIRIYLFDAEMESLHLRASYESSPAMSSRATMFPRGEGVAGKAAELERPIIFEDITQDPLYPEMSPSEHWKKAGMRFFGSFPIRSKLKMVGAVSLADKAARRLTDGEVQLLSSMATQIGIAVENATLYQETAARAKELSALYSVAGLAARFLDVNALLRNIMRKVMEIFDFQAGRIYLLDADKTESRLVAEEGVPADMSNPATYRLGEGLVGIVLQTGEPFLSEDMSADPEYHRHGKKRNFLKHGFRSTFLVPIKVRGETLGVMNLLGKETHSFTRSEIQLINSIAYHLGIAVGNATLFFQLKQKTLELERANRSKDEFLSVVSHELRTPLNVILGFANMLYEKIPGELNAEQERLLERVMRHARELSDMVNGILEVTSLQTGAVKVELEELSLGDFCDGLRLAYEPALKAAVPLRWDCPRDLPVVRTDGEKLKQILRHLIDNAIKFTEQGSVTFAARCDAETRRLTFAVADTGVGISPEMIPSIFEMFRQVDSSETRPFGGVGLGLYMANQLATLLGGRIRVESEPGRGSTFTLELSYRPSGG